MFENCKSEVYYFKEYICTSKIFQGKLERYFIYIHILFYAFMLIAHIHTGNILFKVYGFNYGQLFRNSFNWFLYTSFLKTFTNIKAHTINYYFLEKIEYRKS